MVLLCSNIKKILGNPDKNSLYFRKWKPLKSFLHFGKLNLSVCPIKLFIFQNTETSKKLLMFSQKKAILYSGNPPKIIYVSGNGTFLYFGKGIVSIFRLFSICSAHITLVYLEVEAYSEP